MSLAASRDGTEVAIVNSVPADARLEMNAGSTDPYLRRLERMVQILLGRRLRGAEEIWKLQLDLLKLQREIQKEIGEAKANARRDESARRKLEALREARWHARRLGDAIAWLLLGLDQKTIFPLANNNRNRTGQEDHGSRAMVAMAGALAGREWGFPLLHDITDCLRIGDVTFIKPGMRPRTVEMKAHLVNQTPAARGQVTLDYKVTVVFPAGEDVHDLVLSTGAQEESPAGRSNTHRSLLPGASPRVTRQLRRLRVAKRRQEATLHALSDVEGQPFFSAEVRPSHPGHWEIVRRLIRRARRNGYASESVENSFHYTAIYRREGLDTDTVVNSMIVSDLVGSGLLIEGRPEINSIGIYEVPPRERESAYHFLPYYLYPLPRASIVDLLHGRLLVLIVVNLGRFVMELENAGYNVHLPPDWPRSPFAVSVDSENDAGRRYRTEFGGVLQSHVGEMIYEFHGLRYLVDLAEELRRVGELGVVRLSEGHKP